MIRNNRNANEMDGRHIIGIAIILALVILCLAPYLKWIHQSMDQNLRKPLAAATKQAAPF